MSSHVPEMRLRRRAVPAYFHPHDSADDWARLASTGVELVVANISDGPGIVREERWADAFGSVRATGSDIVGYVDTGYLGLTGLRTQRGSTLLDDWLEQILRDVGAWYLLYGDQVTGIDFDGGLRARRDMGRLLSLPSMSRGHTCQFLSGYIAQAVIEGFSITLGNELGDKSLSGCAI